MALPATLPLASFFGGLRIAEAEFDLPSGQQISRTRGGEILSADIAVRLWRGTATIAAAHHADADALRARLAWLGSAGRSFLAYPSPRIGPRLDPDGAILGASTPVIHTLASNNREMRISGLPPGYALSDGDCLSLVYGSSPVRYGFHQIVVGGPADGGGVTPLLEVIPHIRPGALIGAPVTLVRPVMKAILASAPSYGRIRLAVTDGISFEFIQTLGG